MDSFTDMKGTNTLTPSANPEKRLNGVWQMVLLLGWGVIFLISLVAFVASVVSMNLWDRLPVADLPTYFKGLGQTDMAAIAQFKRDVSAFGFNHAVWAGIFTLFRLVGSMPLFVFAVILAVRRCSSWMALLFASVLAVLGSAGVWITPTFSWASSLLPWMTAPAQVLGVLLWFSLIFLYVFPDGRFTPRWTGWILVALIPITLARVFGLQMFLNPDTWSDVSALLPTIVFVGTAFFSLIYRFQHAGAALRRDQLRGYVIGALLLLGLYFIQFLLTEILPTVTGIDPLPTNQARIVYTLVTEVLWYCLLLVFALGSARSVF